MTEHRIERLEVWSDVAIWSNCNPTELEIGDIFRMWTRKQPGEAWRLWRSDDGEAVMFVADYPGGVAVFGHTVEAVRGFEAMGY
jgi:hypothetical protein